MVLFRVSPQSKHWPCFFIFIFRLCQVLAVARGAFVASWGSFVTAHGFFSCGTQVYILCHLWELSYLTRDRTCVACIERQILNHWTTRGVPNIYFFKKEGTCSCAHQSVQFSSVAQSCPTLCTYNKIKREGGRKGEKKAKVLLKILKDGSVSYSTILCTYFIKTT